MTKQIYTCSYCGNDFERNQSLVTYRIKHTGLDTLYCSLTCHSARRKLAKLVPCLQCGKERLKFNSELKKSPNTFCSKSCAASYNNIHKTYGIRRSKLEAHIEECITRLFPDVTFVCNDKTKIDSELDFYFPDLALALELNGIVHYKPIYGEDKLSQIQLNDIRKVERCKSKDINLYVSDYSSCTYLTKNKKAELWSIVKNILDSHLN